MGSCCLKIFGIWLFVAGAVVLAGMIYVDALARGSLETTGTIFERHPVLLLVNLSVMAAGYHAVFLARRRRRAEEQQTRLAARLSHVIRSGP